MSHFTRVRTKLMDEMTIREALTRMGYTVMLANDGVFGWQGRRAEAAFKVRPSKTRFEIGFVPEPRSGYSIVADWWGVAVVKQEVFTQQLTREYAYVATVATLTAKGFEVQEQVIEDSGEIRMVLRRQVGV
ncbi:hypothetical protein Rhe02_52180 [Rhizocola hellebori]|uniref:DUF1257 domain-containing protein n=1 Tax=Rhizocola hellebori TaxID=1392758 RepID=A0A8J3VIK2_9ACTN|nr:DUF1257 domain-containing protein [Rhizocola hellebori]GIH07151.1 hypothetical protein Rhe02_52180 [Rhizocola hellebori]